MRENQSVSLVLGSGGARGLAHIGIIHWLEEHGYEISSIAGCSMGALVGGVYAAGKMAEFEEWVRAVTKGDMLALLDFSFGTDGLFKGEKIIDTIKAMVGERRIEDLPIPFTAVAANISRGREVWFDKGPLFDAIRASISLPLFFTAFDHNGDDLIDGGILNPVPMAPTLSDPLAITVAVDLNAPPEPDLVIPESRENGSTSKFSAIISDFAGKLASTIPATKENIRALKIVSQSFDAMQGTIARQKLAAYPPDHLVTIPRNLCTMLDFDKADGLIRYGYEQADRTLPHVHGA